MDEERKYCVYKHISPSEKIYIGVTKQSLKKRWGKNGEGYKTQTYFYRAIKKYGWENFRHEILYTDLTKDEACEMEIKLIALYESDNKEKGYNCYPGGEIGPAGRSLSKETREKMSKARKGKKFSDEHKQKIADSRKGVYVSTNAPWYGKKHTEDYKRKMSKPIICIETGIFYYGTRDAEKQTGIAHTGISQACKINGKQKTAGGYHWCYVYDQIQKDGSVIQGAISLGYITEEDIQRLKE